MKNFEADETPNYFYNELIGIFNNSDLANRDKLLRIRTIFKELLKKLTENDSQYFSSNYSRLIFILDKFKIDDGTTIKIKQLHHFFSTISKDKTINIKENDVISSIKTISEIIKLFYKAIYPNELTIIFKDSTEDLSFSKDSKYVSEKVIFLKGILKRKGDYTQAAGYKEAHSTIYIETEEFGEIPLRLYGQWKDIWKLSWNYSVLNIFNVKKISGQYYSLQTTSNTLIVLEPDYMIDVTEIAECFHSSGINIYLYFLRHFQEMKTNFSLVVGNLVNYCFDELLCNPDTDFETAYTKGIKYKPLQVFALLMNSPDSTNILRPTIAKHFRTLKDTIPKLKADYLSIEPSFISPLYGLQGRLDAMLEYEDEKNRKTIIELKSGNPPAPGLTIKDDNGKQIITGIWNNHLAQTTCYNLLLDSTYENRSGSSLILYSKAEEYNLRDAPNLIQKKQEILEKRNWLIALERALIQGTYSLFNSFNVEDFGTVPSYQNKEIIEFENIYKNASEVEKEYFHSYTSFILRELYAEKIGTNENGNRSGYSSLWKDSLTEKEEKLNILTNLELIQEESDFEELHLTFRMDSENPMISSFRKGDICLLYPIESEGMAFPLNQQLIKCSIKNISFQTVIISLRNKQFNKKIFYDNKFWVLEPDHIDSNNKKLFSSIFQLLRADKGKRELLLGLREPEFLEDTRQKSEVRSLKTEDSNLKSEENLENSEFRIQNSELVNVEELNGNQNELFRKAIAAKDYFLIQGPPGTGKTSFLLKNLVKYIFENSEENILILAYTNRAVDEICSALKNIRSDFPFLRLGNKESSGHKDRLISALSDELTLKELYERVLATRIFVSTVSSVLSSSEIMEIKSFNTAIIDEASQILEPQIIGILTKVERFIMIGDEKQLPAVVVQNDKRNVIDNELLNSINIFDLRNSLFERLLTTSVKNNWTHAYGMLTNQARMHLDIQHLVNKLFYNHKLDILNRDSWQEATQQKFNPDSENPIERLLSSSRVIFIDSGKEFKSKIHKGEAKIISSLVKAIYQAYGNEFSENTIGIISPFRAQCSEIYQHLPENLRNIITIDTVERFQGSERNIIIISLATNYSPLLYNIQSIVEIEGMMIDRKLNVAITRAKEHLIILGNSEILNQSPIFNNMLEIIKQDYKYVKIDSNFNIVSI